MLTADLSNRETGVHGFENLFFCYCFLETPGVRIAHVHVLDETHLKAGCSRELDEAQDFIVVRPADDHSI